MPLPCPLPVAALEALAAAHGTPFQLYDEAGIRANCRRLLRAFGARFAGFEQFFAVKALPNPAVLRVLVEEGCGLDCSSVSELHIARALGVPGARCLYTGNYTSAADLAFACDFGATVNLDDVSLVRTLAALRGARGFPALISFRLNPGLGRTDSETPSNVLGGKEAKFGVPPESIVEAYRQARAAGATRFGMHMMTGSCVMNPAYWDETVGILLDAVASVRRALPGVEFEFVNIGGGLGIPYRPDQAPVDVEALAAQLQACVARRWALVVAGEPAPQRAPPRLVMENGRFMTGPFGWLVARCEAEKRAWGQRYLGLDACMSNLMRPGMYGAYHHITVPAREPAAAGAAAAAAVETAPANVVGTLCENNDWFAKERPLPAAARVGDLFVVHDTGAHSHSMGFQYNGKLRAPELLLRERPAGAGTGAGAAVVDVIREREAVECLYDNAVMPRDLAEGLPPSYPYLSSSRGAARRARPQAAAVPALAAAAVAGALVALGVAAAVARARGTVTRAGS